MSEKIKCPHQIAEEIIKDTGEGLPKYECGDIKCKIDVNGFIRLKTLDDSCWMNPNDMAKLCSWYLGINFDIFKNMPVLFESDGFKEIVIHGKRYKLEGIIE